MNVSDFISTAREQSHTPVTLVTDAQAIILLNVEYQDWISVIKSEIGENYFFKEYLNDVVAGSVDYPIDIPTWETEGIDKIIRVGVKYDPDQVNFTTCTPMSLKTLDETLDFYKLNQSRSNPFYTISENMIRIYPASLVDVSDGAYLAGLYTPIDLVLGGDESSILIPRQHQKGLFYSLMARMFQKRGKSNDEQFYQGKADLEKESMIVKMGSRVQSPLAQGQPDISHLA